MFVLPNELLKLIFDDLESHRDAANRSRVRKHFHDLVDVSTRKMYSRIKLWKNERLQAEMNMLLSILRNPYLGTYLRHIELYQAPASSYNDSFNWLTEPPVPTSPQPQGSEPSNKPLSRWNRRAQEEYGCVRYLIT
jgi:hypothetical protein